MNMSTKIGLVGDEGQPIELTWRFHTNFAFGLEEVKRNNEGANRFPTDLTKCNMIGQPYPTSSHLVWATDVV